MGLRRQSVDDVLDCEGRCTEDLARRFGILVGATPELYLHMQVELDRWEAGAGA
jgi:plasmid maintenance system antidote protein VapI